MRKRLTIIPCLALLFLMNASCGRVKNTFDVLIVGGGASGVTAGVQSARLGANTLIVEPTQWLGGMLTAAGVSATDGNYNLPGGLWGEFREELERHYGGADSLRTGWVSGLLFEPSVGNRIFHSMVGKEKNLEVWKNTEFIDAEHKEGFWTITLKGNGGTTKSVKAKVLIDATELGDIAKACGVGYDVGMESREQTGEDVAPLLGNDIVQDLTYVAILKEYGRDVTIPRPEGYDPAEFACSCINLRCVDPKEPERIWSKEMMITYGRLPNGKYMINWPIEGNDYYVNLIEMSPEDRDRALEAAKSRTMRFVYFIQNELGYNTLGLADDEYPTDDRLPLMPYHRESRRIHGLVRFTLDHIVDPYRQSEKLYRTSIAVGDYPVDHHHARYDGTEDLPDLHFYPVPSYGLPLGTLIPQNVEGLIVAEKSISVSNVVNGTTRLQPVVLQIGQAAGVLAALAVQQKVDVKEVPVRDVQNEILAGGGYLLPYLDVKVSHPTFKSLQRIGSTGVMKGVGKSVNWSNQSWFRADTVLLASELDGLVEFYPEADSFIKSAGDCAMTVGQGVELIKLIIKSQHMNGADDLSKAVEEIWAQSGFVNPDYTRAILRGEMGVLLDRLLDPFNNRALEITGKLIEQ